MLALSGALHASDGCQSCHPDRLSGFADGHAFAARDCVRCHAGDAGATTRQRAHRGLIAFPGLLKNASRSCGECHAERVASVTAGVMHRAPGMVAETRRALGQAPNQPGADVAHLDHGIADSLLRKLCVGCHLGQDKTAHALDPVNDRGGGCLACHIQSYPTGRHPRLSAQVEDQRCFGCHSRSARIALNYAGLAEIDTPSSAMAGGRAGRLSDGRLVETRPPDHHHQAGMACVDCHTAPGLMGHVPDPDIPGGGPPAGPDIACTDCHANQNPTVTAQNWPPEFRWMLKRIPFAYTPEQAFLTTATGTPLWHIEVAGEGNFLHLKLKGSRVPIPALSPGPHSDSLHQRLNCDACHAQWAPQCHGCHMEYSDAGWQWDHVDQKATSGRWQQRRWAIRNTLPPLGVDSDGEIGPVVPGMIMSVSHPQWAQERFERDFAALSPHTTGPARSCESCHTRAETLGLGTGDLRLGASGWSHRPSQPALADGLPADAWTDARAENPNNKNPRPFSRREILRILRARLNDAKTSDPASGKSPPP